MERFKKANPYLATMQIHKKSEAGLTIIAVLIIIVIFLGWLFNFSQRECRTNKDCSSEEYCGSDFACHSYPTIQKTVVQYNFVAPSVIIGIAIVIATIIFNWDKIKQRANQEQIVKEERKDENLKIQEPKEVEEIAEPYYKSNTNIKTP